MSILSGLTSNLAGRGAGRTKFPAGTHIVQLTEIEVLTSWGADKQVTWKWDDSNEVEAVAIVPKYQILDGSDAAPMSIQPIVLPLSIPQQFQEQIDAIATYKKGDPKLAGTAWRYHFARQDFLSFLNVAMGQDAATFVENPPELFEDLRAMVASGTRPELQVTVEYKQRANDPTKTNTEVEYALV